MRWTEGIGCHSFYLFPAIYLPNYIPCSLCWLPVGTCQGGCYVGNTDMLEMYMLVLNTNSNIQSEVKC